MTNTQNILPEIKEELVGGMMKYSFTGNKNYFLTYGLADRARRGMK